MNFRRLLSNLSSFPDKTIDPSINHRYGSRAPANPDGSQPPRAYVVGRCTDFRIEKRNHPDDPTNKADLPIDNAKDLNGRLKYVLWYPYLPTDMVLLLSGYRTLINGMFFTRHFCYHLSGLTLEQLEALVVMVEECPENKIERKRLADKTLVIFQLPPCFKELILKALFLCRFGGSTRQVSQFWWIRDSNTRHLVGLTLIRNALVRWARSKQRAINGTHSA